MTTIRSFRTSRRSTERAPRRGGPSIGLATLALLGALGALAPLSIDAVLPALPQIRLALAATPAQTQAQIGVFMLAFAIGQLIFGSLSDRLGRRPVLLVGIALMVAGGCACALAPSIGWLILVRFIAGLGASAGTVVARAIVRDRVDDPARNAHIQGYLTAAIIVAPVIAPLLGAAILPWGWRAIYAMLAAASVMLLLWIVVGLPESHRGHDGQSPWGAYASYLRTRRHAALTACAGFAFAGAFAFIAGSSFALQAEFGFDAPHFAIAFALASAASLVGSLIAGPLAVRVGVNRATTIAVVLLAFAALGAALDAAFRLPSAAFVAAFACYMFAFGVLLPNVFALGMQDVPHLAGTAAALIGAAQYFGASAGTAIASTLPFAPAAGIGFTAASCGICGVLCAALGAPSQRVQSTTA